ncbi:TetR/AcrR family transcriptional regulator [Lentzea flaviverrucosa]|uniref:Transcriptional regulator, TetR family n=1 Tax=Lentzea flaviverrucosa TaxID=200379 RepID=A0A1H9CVB7_9PSEU|nr:TetR/AcrR family transcriptional regulator [Lentzea flaviverrucosa]RDI24658.1 TetR family transcriptional regulator [Lentzea flaviverrucosa]SEQ05125.1 transcriptional regulator, TetR family [Lentzea flaviverrucosa]
MTEVASRKQDRIARRQVDKFDARRTELAVATLHTLADLGYARTSLREIAQNSEFSHGVLHYYFADKRDLITEAVRQYEVVCVTRYDEVVATSATAEQLRAEFVAMFFDTLGQDAPLHRLWYDLRTQSLFDESFRADVLEIDGHREDMVWRVVSRYAELLGGMPSASPGTTYVTLDGIFQRALLHHFTGNADAVAQLRTELPAVIDLLVTRAG